MDSKTEYLKLSILPWPEFSAASYRAFYKNEKHITRICDYYVLIFMLERTLFFQENGDEITVNKGEWYIQRPGLLQHGQFGSPAPIYFYIHFYAEENVTEEPSNQNLNEKWEKSTVILPIRGMYDCKLIKPLFDQLDYCYINNPYDILSQQSIFLSILNSITVPNYHENHNELAFKITQYISKNYNKEITCDRLADKFHFSTEYINRKVKHFSGLTPMQYLQHIRISRAKELLSNTDHTLSYITSEIGYQDVTVFYKAFKKHTGMSAGRWRKSSRGL